MHRSNCLFLRNFSHVQHPFQSGVATTGWIRPVHEHSLWRETWRDRGSPLHRMVTSRQVVSLREAAL